MFDNANSRLKAIVEAPSDDKIADNCKIGADDSSYLVSLSRCCPSSALLANTIKHIKLCQAGCKQINAFEVVRLIGVAGWSVLRFSSGNMEVVVLTLAQTYCRDERIRWSCLKMSAPHIIFLLCVVSLL